LIMSSCGSPPKLGHYTGTNPDVTFDITSKGIENFEITVPFAGSTCTLGPLSEPLSIKSNGAFSYKVDLPGSKISNSLTGKIAGDVVSGNDTFLFCMDGGQLTTGDILNPPLDKWSASLNGQ